MCSVGNHTFKWKQLWHVYLKMMCHQNTTENALSEWWFAYPSCAMCVVGDYMCMRKCSIVGVYPGDCGLLHPGIIDTKGFLLSECNVLFLCSGWGSSVTAIEIKTLLFWFINCFGIARWQWRFINCFQIARWQWRFINCFWIARWQWRFINCFWKARWQWRFINCFWIARWQWRAHELNCTQRIWWWPSDHTPPVLGTPLERPDSALLVSKYKWGESLVWINVFPYTDNSKGRHIVDFIYNI